jgi:hemerythrin
VDFTRVHFQAEEALMALAAYPDTAAHASAHARFLEEAREVQRVAAAAEAPRALASVAGLGRALRDHVSGFDADFDRWGEARRSSSRGR